jgi:hypothetical protein
MNRRTSLGVLASGILGLVSICICGMAQTSATPNPSTLPVPTQTNPAGTGGSNTATPPGDPTPPASPAPAPPAKQTAPQNQQNAPTTNPAVEQTSPTGNNAITKPTAPSANPGSTTPGAAESSAAAGVGALNAGGLTSDQLHQRIDAALNSEPTLSGSNLTVNVSDDAIDLSGTVTSSKDRVTARRIVQSFAGNRRVRERVTVGGARSSNPPPNGPKDESATPKGEKSEKSENVNRPITDPAKHGDASEEPRRM